MIFFYSCMCMILGFFYFLLSLHFNQIYFPFIVLLIRQEQVCIHQIRITVASNNSNATLTSFISNGAFGGRGNDMGKGVSHKLVVLQAFEAQRSLLEGLECQEVPFEATPPKRGL